MSEVKLLNLRGLLKVAEEQEFGIIAANCIREEIVRGVLRAAWDLNSPVIVQVAESQVDYALDGWFSGTTAERLKAFRNFVISEIVKMREQKGFMIPIALHLDHLQKKDNLAIEAMEAGFTSVELDFSDPRTEEEKKAKVELSRKEAVERNIQRSLPIIEKLHRQDVTVEVEEGEIGEAAARARQTEEEIINEFTKVEDAVRLVEGTNPDALAIFIGSAHGWYLKRPIIGFSRIREIAVALKERGFSVPIVLHGGTGLTYEAFHKAIGAGARKFNYATALADKVLRTIERTEEGAKLIEEMREAERKDSEAKGRKPRGERYIIGKYAKQIDALGHYVLQAAEDAVYEHVRDLIINAFGSKDKAPLYGPEYGRYPAD